MASLWALYQPQKLFYPTEKIEITVQRRATAWEGRQSWVADTGEYGYFELDHIRFLTECAVIGATTGAFILLLGLEKKNGKETD